MPHKASDGKDLSLAEQGLARIEWALHETPVLRGLIEQFRQERPLDSRPISPRGKRGPKSVGRCGTFVAQAVPVRRTASHSRGV